MPSYICLPFHKPNRCTEINISNNAKMLIAQYIGYHNMSFVLIQSVLQYNIH